MIVGVADIAVFTGLAVAGLAWRRRPDVHKRLMLLATLGGLMWPAITRMPIVAGRFVPMFALLSTLVLAPAIRDLWRGAPTRWVSLFWVWAFSQRFRCGSSWARARRGGRLPPGWCGKFIRPLSSPAQSRTLALLIGGCRPVPGTSRVEARPNRKPVANSVPHTQATTLPQLHRRDGHERRSGTEPHLPTHPTLRLPGLP